MSELSNIKALIRDELTEYRDPDVDIDTIYNEILQNLCGVDLCGNMDCHFCPLDTIDKFIKEYGDQL